jgi:glycosyltransferase involved in cell wall biosynthesis
MIKLNKTESNIKHSFLMITYNQENYIIEALDSVFKQSVLPYEVIISDDCSSDNTFQVISDYKNRYPQIIKAYKQECNLGIFKNQNFVLDLATGDVVTFLGGDDFLKLDLFEELNYKIINENINLNEKFVIVTNISHIYHDKELIINNFNKRNNNPFKLRLRNKIHYNSVGISRKLIQYVGHLPLNYGYHGDLLWNLKIDLLSEKHYYIDMISSTYRVGSGIISKTKEKDLLKSRLIVIKKIKNEYINELNFFDRNYLKLEVSFLEYKLNPSFANYFKYLFSAVTNIGNVNLKHEFIQVHLLVPYFLIYFYRIIKKRK